MEEELLLNELIFEDSVTYKHDKGYKFLLSSKRIFLQLLRSFVKQGLAMALA